MGVSTRIGIAPVVDICQGTVTTPLLVQSVRSITSLTFYGLRAELDSAFAPQKQQAPVQMHSNR